MVGGRDQWSLELPFGVHVHKITYGPLIDTALYVMCPLLGPLEGGSAAALAYFGP